MRTLISAVAVLALCGCAMHTAAQNRKEDRFINEQEKIISAHEELLKKSGHWGDKATTPEYVVLGHYDWYGDGGGYFGAYAFSQQAYEQAQKGWFTHAEVIEGSNELWADYNVDFDGSVVGKPVRLAMSWIDAKHNFQYADFAAKIVSVLPREANSWGSDGSVGYATRNRLLLDKRAPHYAETYDLEILPSDWQDLCGCTNNFGPTFVDGKPVVKEKP